MQGLGEGKLIVDGYKRMACFQLKPQMGFIVFQLLSFFPIE